MSYIDLNDENICGVLDNNHILMTKTKYLFSCDYKCFFDPVNQLVHNDKDYYDYKIVVSNIKRKHLIYDKIRQIGSIELQSYTQYKKVYLCNLTNSNERFTITKTTHDNPRNNDRTAPLKLIFNYNGNKYESKRPIKGKKHYTVRLTRTLTNYIKSSRSNIIIVDNNDDTLFECVKIDTKSKYIITSSEKIPLIYSFILSCINNFSI